MTVTKMEGSDTLDPTTINCVGIVPAMHKPRISGAVKEVIAWLQERGVRALLPEDRATGLSLPDLGVELDALGDCADLLLSMGGDGTYLATARIAAPRGKPVVGINLGGFGFLASIPSGDRMLPALESMFTGPQVIQDRMMLSAAVIRDDTEVASFIALNDIVVGKGAFSRLFRIRTTISGQQISHFPADGMIVSTPTGSTGYALAAGGPVVDPRVRVIVLTPICAHALSARTLVLPPDRVISIELPDLRSEEVKLTSDGQEGFALRVGDRVEIREAPFPTRAIALKDANFYARLRSKLGWGSQR